MASSSSHFRLMAMLMIVGIIAMNTPSVVAPKPKPPPKIKSPPPPKPPKGPPGPIQQGLSDTFQFIKNCAFYMHIVAPGFIKPNASCCASAKKVNISLFCKAFFIPNTEKVFSPKKVAGVAKYCGNPIPVRSRCGTYVVKS